jgi:hypothetical protein
MRCILSSSGPSHQSGIRKVDTRVKVGSNPPEQFPPASVGGWIVPSRASSGFYVDERSWAASCYPTKFRFLG